MSKTKIQEYSQRPEVKARRQEYNQRPDVKARKREYNKKRYQLNKEKQWKYNNKIWYQNSEKHKDNQQQYYQNSEERQLKLQLENNDYQKEIMVNTVNKIADQYPAINVLSEHQKIWKFYL